MLPNSLIGINFLNPIEWIADWLRLIELNSAPANKAKTDSSAPFNQFNSIKQTSIPELSLVSFPRIDWLNWALIESEWRRQSELI